MQPQAWMRTAGFGTWMVAVAPTSVAFARHEIAASRAVAFALAAVAFLAAFVAACRVPIDRRTPSLALRVAQSVAAIAMVWWGRDVVTAAILVVVASQLPGLLPGGVAVAWIVVQSLVIPLRFANLGPALANCAAFVGFQAFALAAASLAASERRARAVAAEQGRTIERLRVARDLHDSLGHHLAALGMQLEVAARLVDGRAKEHVERAHAIGRLLLADVRGAVSDLRDPRPLGAALRTLVAASDNVVGHLDLADELDGLAGDHADAIVRFVQEVLTNVARHSDARNVWIVISADRTTIRLSARDDGQRAAAAIVWGHGLTGMKERFVSLEGRVDARRNADGGFEVEASMPRRVP
ncbi:MAG TPA: histidine kinase [Kofleriaceae bacterium]|jgi:signal transduction histidine kinase